MEPTARVRHELKCWPEFFEATMAGIKRFELRRDDRPEGFRVGDELLLKEWAPMVCDTHFSHTSNPEEAQERGYTGREVLVRVDYLMPADTIRFLIHPLLEPDEWDAFVIMSVSLVN